MVSTRKAAQSGCLAQLQAAAEVSPWDTYTCHDAAEAGHLDCLTWALQYEMELHDNFDSSLTAWAARAGRVDSLTVIEQHGALALTKGVCAQAAAGGSLQALQVSVSEHGIPSLLHRLQILS